VKHEMIWTKLWFGYHKKQWEDRMETEIALSKPGHYAYAAKQAGIWSQFLETAREEFGVLLSDKS
jgi:hypothetical protein